MRTKKGGQMGDIRNKSVKIEEGMDIKAEEKGQRLLKYVLEHAPLLRDCNGSTHIYRSLLEVRHAHKPIQTSERR
jgi:hypothetical protein